MILVTINIKIMLLSRFEPWTFNSRAETTDQTTHHQYNTSNNISKQHHGYTTARSSNNQSKRKPSQQPLTHIRSTEPGQQQHHKARNQSISSTHLEKEIATRKAFCHTIQTSPHLTMSLCP